MNRYLKNVKSLATYLTSVDDALDNLRNINAWLHTLHRELVSQKTVPFVSILVEGYNQFGSPIWLGEARNLKETRDGEFTFDVLIPLHNVRICVFADLKMVHISGIYCGPNLIQGGLGSCPVAYVNKIELGMKIRIICEVRNK